MNNYKPLKHITIIAKIALILVGIAVIHYTFWWLLYKLIITLY